MRVAWRCAFGLLALLAAACSSSSARSAVPSKAAQYSVVQYSVLFDDTKAETAGNADWIISTAMPDPRAQDAAPSDEAAWTGGISAWGVALQRSGRYSVQTLPPAGSITYGDGSNPLDLSRFDVFVLPEPNILFTAAEKRALLRFVRSGGGLFLISDHTGSDRNNDGADSVDVLEDLLSNSGDPFGFSIDPLNIGHENPDVLAPSDPVLSGPFGRVTGTILRNGTTATLHPGDNAAVRGAVFRSGSSASGTTEAAFVTSRFGAGRVAFWGDSSAIDDGTGQPGNTLHDGWDDSAGSDATLALNATEWLARAG